MASEMSLDRGSSLIQVTDCPTAVEHRLKMVFARKLDTKGPMPLALKNSLSSGAVTAPSLLPSKGTSF
jgi:hypothetical protein